MYFLIRKLVVVCHLEREYGISHVHCIPLHLYWFNLVPGSPQFHVPVAAAQSDPLLWITNSYQTRKSWTYEAHGFCKTQNPMNYKFQRTSHSNWDKWNLRPPFGASINFPFNNSLVLAMWQLIFLSGFDTSNLLLSKWSLCSWQFCSDSWRPIHFKSTLFSLFLFFFWWGTKIYHHISHYPLHQSQTVG